MNLVKTLMVYMAITASSAIQAAVTPTPAPITPSPVPTATVEVLAPLETLSATPQTLPPVSPEATQTPSLTNPPTAKPTLTPKPTAIPAPEITPNTAYKTLNLNDRGDNVKQMQERLIELGYLKGDADGAFGYQTRNAVLAFQKNNGLSRDGVAGKTTLTVLFEYEAVRAAE